MFDALLTRVRNVFRREAMTREMEEELRAHLEQSAALLVRRGMTPDEARLAARQAMGNATVIAEDAHATRGRFFDDLRRDVLHATRALLRTPGFTAVVIVTLALGFGVNGAFFAVMKRAMSPSSIVQAENWLMISDHWSWEEYQQVSRQTRSMTEWSAHADEVVLLGPDTPPWDASSHAPKRRLPSVFQASSSATCYGVADSTAILPSSGAISASLTANRSPWSASCRNCSRARRCEHPTSGFL